MHLAAQGSSRTSAAWFITLADILTIRGQDSATPIPGVAVANYTIPIINPVDITSSLTLPQATQGVAYSTPFTFSGTGPFVPVVIDQGGANTWSFSGNNFVGTPTSAETDTPTILVFDALGIPQSRQVSIVVNSSSVSLLFTPGNSGPPLPDAFDGIAYSVTCQALNGTGPFTLLAGPGWMSLTNVDSTHFTLSGNPTGSGTVTVTIQSTT